MINPMFNTTDTLLDFQVLSGELIPLESDYYRQAIESSDRISHSSQKWQVYLNVLALLSFESWLKERARDIRIENRDYSALQPEFATVPEAICYLSVGDFNICLLATESLMDKTVRIPKAAIEQPDFAAHFYVIIEVLEEEEQASISGFLGYDKLVDYRDSFRLETTSDAWSYELPLDWFDVDANHLLLALSLTTPAAFKLPVAPVKTLETISPIKAEGKKALSFLQQGVEQAINVALWLGDEIDEFARNLGWGMPAPLTPAVASGWRSTEQFDGAIVELMQQGMEIPNNARGSCQTLSLDGISLKLFAASWCLPMTAADTQDCHDEWSLLLILGTESGHFLPQGIRLQIADQTDILSDQILETHEFYLVSSVIGDLGDRFFVTITLNGKTLNLPPFVFAPTSSLFL